MKNIVKRFLFIAVIITANISFAQNVDEDIAIYPGIHHYQDSVRIERRNSEAPAWDAIIPPYEPIYYYYFSGDEIADIFNLKLDSVSIELEKINKTAKEKKDGMIILDEYGRKIFIAVEALKNNHIILEGGDFKNDIFYPNMISTNGMSCQDNEKNPGNMILAPLIIFQKK